MVVVAQDPISGGKWIVIVWINVIKDDLKNVGKVNDPFRTYFTHSAADGCYLLPVASFKLLFRVQALNRVLNAAFFNVATMRREEDGKRTLAEWRGPPKWKIKKFCVQIFWEKATTPMLLHVQPVFELQTGPIRTGRNWKQFCRCKILCRWFESFYPGFSFWQFLQCDQMLEYPHQFLHNLIFFKLAQKSPIFFGLLLLHNRPTWSHRRQYRTHIPIVHINLPIQLGTAHHTTIYMFNFATISTGLY